MQKELNKTHSSSLLLPSNTAEDMWICINFLKMPVIFSGMVFGDDILWFYLVGHQVNIIFDKT